MVLDRIGPTRTGICMAFEAVTGIVLAAIFLGETVRPVVAIGGAAVLGGAVLAALVSPAPVEVVERVFGSVVLSALVFRNDRLGG